MARVLVIEPNKMLADAYCKVLDDAGLEVMHCTTAQDAITNADQHRPDVVVTELQLAGHSGVEFLYEFRSYPEWRNIAVIILTQIPFDDSGLSQKALEDLGIRDYLYKPETSLKKLLKVMDGLTSEQQ
jgi:CheY-like chemotaxis protein